MITQRLAFLLACLFGIAPMLSAAVSERDFLAPGDGLLTYDNVNGREWLDLTETLDWSLAELHDAISPGGPLQEFRIVSLEDLTGLAASAGVEWLPPDQFFPAPPGDSPSKLIDLVGVILDYSVYNYDVGDVLIHDGGIVVDFDDYVVIDILEALGLRAAGGAMVNDLVGGELAPRSYHLVTVIAFPPPSLPGAANRPLGEFSNQSHGGILLDSQPLTEQVYGPFWLYRTAIPEPSSIVLLMLGISVCIAKRANRNWRRED